MPELEGAHKRHRTYRDTVTVPNPKGGTMVINRGDRVVKNPRAKGGFLVVPGTDRHASEPPPIDEPDEDEDGPDLEHPGSDETLTAAPAATRPGRTGGRRRKAVRGGKRHGEGKGRSEGVDPGQP